jgi:signal recognition particle receptor subunit beta
MADSNPDGGAVDTRILYWGIESAGKSANLRTINSRLRSDHRGQLQEIATRLDPTVSYEILPIELGEVKGVRTRLQIIAVPGAPEQAPTRKQLLDRVDGLVLVIDSQRERIEDNVASLEELREALAAYGRSLEELPLVVQYNKVDLSDSTVLEELHRRLALPESAVFESVATESNGPLRSLTTISKQVVKMLRDRPPAPAPEPVPDAAPAEVMAPPPQVEPIAELDAREFDELEPDAELSSERRAPVRAVESTALMEQAILEEADHQEEAEAAASAALEAQTVLDRPWDQLAGEVKQASGVRLGPDLQIVSVGTATCVDVRAVRLPLVLGNSDGETLTLALTIALDPLLDADEDDGGPT